MLIKHNNSRGIIVVIIIETLTDTRMHENYTHQQTNTNVFFPGVRGESKSATERIIHYHSNLHSTETFTHPHTDEHKYRTAE